jgi:hypothetical protein
MRQPIVVVVGVLFVVALAVVNFTPLRDYLISLPAAAETESSTSLPPREILVTTTMTTADFVSERVCLDQEGPHVIEADAASENAATGFLALDDGSTEGKYVASAMRFAGQTRRIRSEEVVLHAGEPCYLVSVHTGIVGERATIRLIRLAADE